MKYIKSKVIYKGRRVELVEASYLNKNNEERVMEHIYVKPAVAILAINDKGNFIFIKEKRTAIGNDEVISIPAGLVEEGEEKENAALRELEEETGYVAENIKFISWFYSTCGFTNERVDLYFCDNVKIQNKQKLDEDEEIQILEVSIKDAFEMLEKGKLNNAIIQNALLWYKYYNSRKDD